MNTLSVISKSYLVENLGLTMEKYEECPNVHKLL